MQLDGLLNSFKNSLSPRNYDALVSILATEVTNRLERAIKKSTFNRVSTVLYIYIKNKYNLTKFDFNCSLVDWFWIRKFGLWAHI